MLRRLMLAAIASVALAVSAPAFMQGQSGTAAEAKAMIEKAVTELKANQAAALAKFNKAGGGFRDRDLYAFCFDTTTGVRTAHVIVEYIGMDIRPLKEKDGSPLGQKIFDAANKVKEGEITTVNYNFPRPGSTQPIAKETYVTRVGNQGCGVGYYK
jgi:hypothetical protein